MHVRSRPYSIGGYFVIIIINIFYYGSLISKNWSFCTSRIFCGYGVYTVVILAHQEFFDCDPHAQSKCTCCESIPTKGRG